MMPRLPVVIVSPPPPPPPPCRALDQLVSDPERVDLAELWRPYSRLHLQLQRTEGPPLTKIQKLRVGGQGSVGDGGSG